MPKTEVPPEPPTLPSSRGPALLARERGRAELEKLRVSKRRKTFNFRLNDSDRELFASVAGHYRMTIAQMIKAVVRREAQRMRIET